MFSSCIQAVRRLWARFLACGRSETGLPRLYFQKSQHMQEERVSGRSDFGQIKKTFSDLGKENGSTFSAGISWRTWLEMKESGHEVTRGAGSKAWYSPKIAQPSAWCRRANLLGQCELE